MNRKTWLRTLTSLALFMACASGAGTTAGCGSDVATCATVCGFSDAPAGCLNTCGAAESACSLEACSAQFQESLTCYGNTGSFRAGSDVCGALGQTVETHSTSMTSSSSGDGGSSDDGGDSHGGSCASATCASVCATEGEETQSCLDGCTTSQATCSDEASGFQALLSCICQAGGLVSSTSTTIATQCEAVLLALESSCPGLDQGSMITIEDAGP